MDKELASWIIVKQIVEVIGGFEWTMEIDSMIICRQRFHNNFFIDNTCYLINVLDQRFFLHFQGKQIAGNSVSD